MKPFVILSFTALFLVGRLSATPSKTSPEESPFNFEAAMEYFSLVDKIKDAGKLHTEDWERFLAIEGNRLFIEENNISKSTLKLIKKEIEWVYIAENDSLLQASLANDLRLQIRNRYKENEQVYKQHIERLKSDPAQLKDSIQTLTKEFLPPRMHQVDTFPKVYFHALWDGSASSKGVFVDIILAYDFDQKRWGSFIAHELHHYMRGSLLEGVEIDSIDQGAIWAIESIFNEGFADMVDKSALIFEGSDWWLNEQYMALLNYAGAIMTSLNTKFKEELGGKHHTEDEYREVLAHSVGHIPGQYMAQTIKDAGRLPEIIQKADDPFAFFLIYQEIASAKKDESPILDAESLTYLKKLQAKYIK